MLCCSYKNVRLDRYRPNSNKFKEWCNKHNVDKGAIPLLERMLTLNPKDRINAQDAYTVSAALQLSCWCHGSQTPMFRCAVLQWTSLGIVCDFTCSSGLWVMARAHAGHSCMPWVAFHLVYHSMFPTSFGYSPWCCCCCCCCLSQDNYFFNEPRACEPSELPHVPDAHEWTMKRTREQQKAAARGPPGGQGYHGQQQLGGPDGRNVRQRTDYGRGPPPVTQYPQVIRRSSSQLLSQTPVLPNKWSSVLLRGSVAVTHHH